jgi:LPPG:FO 2-phospho-L-lactate transferase
MPARSASFPLSSQAASLNVVALAGGVGGARLADGLAQILPPENLTVIVNTGDDFEHLGLHICPDLDTVCYTLAGLANPATGWGRSAETWQALETLATLGGPTWFRLGDHDLGMHLERTRRSRLGQPLSQITRHFCRALGIQVSVLPVSDDPVATWVDTGDGALPFQEYFVHRQCQPIVSGFHFVGAAQAHPAPGVQEAIDQADLVVFCPSNPWVSIDPILAIPGLRLAVQSRPTLAVSPIIGGQAVKGPAAKMFTEMGLEPSALAVARHYGKMLKGFILDHIDALQAQEIQSLEIKTYLTDTLMRTIQDRGRLAKEVVEFGLSLL